VLPITGMPEITEAIQAMTTAEGYLRTGARFGLEGFFAAVLERTREG
jgi:hypothetical protein